ncbi:hypothetical protein BOX15_Mlig004862g2 [Macrostomum lignano]|uniref:CHAT domain-containing protein n=3 Tax=Macrostomum lignano TaxID=282301 RepID=A0A267H103_9PLAT|nr:hypothetical protein BOX15_Mlig004862g2 [Macrostomum lignano]
MHLKHLNNQNSLFLFLQYIDEALEMEPNNHVLLSNRCAARLKLGEFGLALQDARKCRTLAPDWPKAYYREGVALQCLGKFADAAAALCQGLGKDPKDRALIQGLVDCALASPVRERFLPVYEQLCKLHLANSAFVLMSVIGQELESLGQHPQAITALECALQLGTSSLKLKASVLSALSRAHWSAGRIDRAVTYMQQDLSVVHQLGDEEGQCRAHGNLGAAHFVQGDFAEALAHQKQQLRCALKLRQRDTAIHALTNLGHLYSALGDLTNALSSHRQCALLCHQSDLPLLEAAEIGSVGSVYLAMGELDNALECHSEQLRLANRLGSREERCRALLNLGSDHLAKREPGQAWPHLEEALAQAQQLGDPLLQGRACGALGACHRLDGDLAESRRLHEAQLNCALRCANRELEAAACGSLGLVYQLLGDYESAVKLHKAHLRLAELLHDRPGRAKALGNIGCSYSAMRQPDLALRYHTEELELLQQCYDRQSECACHGRLGAAYQSLRQPERAAHHLQLQLDLARELRANSGDQLANHRLLARALESMAGFLASGRGDCQAALELCSEWRRLCSEINDSRGEAAACHRLGCVCHQLGRWREAEAWHRAELQLLQRPGCSSSCSAIWRARCQLGLCLGELGDWQMAAEEFQECLQLARGDELQQQQPDLEFHSLGHLADASMSLGDTAQAMELRAEQLQLAGNRPRLLVAAHAGLGEAHSRLGNQLAALRHHQLELELARQVVDEAGRHSSATYSLERQSHLGDSKLTLSQPPLDQAPVCQALCHLGGTNLALSNVSSAVRCFEEALRLAQESGQPALEARACGQLAAAKVSSSEFEQAIGYLEQQLSQLDRLPPSRRAVDGERGEALCRLGVCYESLGDWEGAVGCYERYLALCQRIANLAGQQRALAGLAACHRHSGSLQQALVCQEKRLVVAHEAQQLDWMASAYGEMGGLHAASGNFEQAIGCLTHQLRVAKQAGSPSTEAEAASGLGRVYQQMSDFGRSLEFHLLDLRLAESNSLPEARCRAYGNIGLAYEAQGDYRLALDYQERHLRSAGELAKEQAKLSALTALGRIHHCLAGYGEAIRYLRDGLQAAEKTGYREEEARLRHRLGLSLWASGRLSDSRQQLQSAFDLFDELRRGERQRLASEQRAALLSAQTACSQALQRVLAALGRPQEALVAAETCQARPFVDLLLDRQAKEADAELSDILQGPMTYDEMLRLVRDCDSSLVYFSLAAGYLYTWLLTPADGLVAFRQTDVNQLDPDFERGGEDSEAHSVASVSAGFFAAPAAAAKAAAAAAAADSLSLASGRSGGSGASGSGIGRRALGHLYSVLIAELEPHLPQQQQQQRPSLIIVPQGDLYLVPFSLLKSSSASVASAALGDRFNISLAPSLHCLLHCRQQLLPLQHRPKDSPVTVAEATSARDGTDASAAAAAESLQPHRQLIVGNPWLPRSVADRHLWCQSAPPAEHECRSLADLLAAAPQPLLGRQATRRAVLQQLMQQQQTDQKEDSQPIELLHFAANISWSQSAIVLAPPVQDQQQQQQQFAEASSAEDANLQSSSLSDLLLTPHDLTQARLPACRLVVLSCGHVSPACQATSDGLQTLCRSFLAAGARCCLVCLWPAPDKATRALLKSFYTGLLQDQPAGVALRAAQALVRAEISAAPQCWAGWALIGDASARLRKRSLTIARSLSTLIGAGTSGGADQMRKEALRILLHLIEKSLQRIVQGCRTPMYTSQLSVEKKVGRQVASSRHWHNLLAALGFRLTSGVGKTTDDLNAVPSDESTAAVLFFPTLDPAERLAQTSACLMALLGLPDRSLGALSRLLAASSGQQLRQLVDLLLASTSTSSRTSGRPTVSSTMPRTATAELRVPVQLWRGSDGCHELLSSLGFDLLEVGQEFVLLQLSGGGGGRQAGRLLQLAATALLGLQDVANTPVQQQLVESVSSSSQESLLSVHSGQFLPVTAADTELLAEIDDNVPATPPPSQPQPPPPPPPGFRRPSQESESDLPEAPSAKQQPQPPPSKAPWQPNEGQTLKQLIYGSGDEQLQLLTGAEDSVYEPNLSTITEVSDSELSSAMSLPPLQPPTSSSAAFMPKRLSVLEERTAAEAAATSAAGPSSRQQQTPTRLSTVAAGAESTVSSSSGYSSTRDGRPPQQLHLTERDLERLTRISVEPTTTATAAGREPARHPAAGAASAWYDDVGSSQC